MILIADSGSTKTDWRLVDSEKKITQLRTNGLSPYHLSGEEIAKIVSNEFSSRSEFKEITEIFFYGTGCSTKKNTDTVADALRRTFIKANIHVDHDLIAAARALCGKEPGIAAILGTGSNSCMYDGEKITAHVPSLGYILGDEGSGAHIGRKFIQSFLYDELPGDLKKKILEKYQINIEVVLDTVYRKPQANQYIASFGDIVHKNITHPFLVKLVYDCFEEFFNHHICKYDGYSKLTFNAVGSIAYFYWDILKAVAADKGMAPGRVLQSPIAGLTLYHVGETV